MTAADILHSLVGRQTAMSFLQLNELSIGKTLPDQYKLKLKNNNFLH